MKAQNLYGLVLFLASLPSAHAFGRSSQIQCRFDIPETTYADLVKRTLTDPEHQEHVPAMALYLVDGRGDIQSRLFSVSEHTPRAVASTQKMITAWVTLRSRSLDESLEYTADDDWHDSANEGVPARHRDGRQFTIGDRATIKEFLQTLLEQSSNAAAAALARDPQSGSHRPFVKKMNDAANQLLSPHHFNTYFQNPSGLTDSESRLQQGDSSATQHSTADNMARLMARIMATPEGKTLESLGIRNAAGTGIFQKYGYTQAAGRTVVIHWRLPKSCQKTARGLVLAAFGAHRAPVPLLIQELESLTGLSTLRFPQVNHNTTHP